MFQYEVDRFMGFAFILMLVLIGVVYFTGVKTDATTFFQGAQGLANVFTGRNASGGGFQGYPSGTTGAA